MRSISSGEGRLAKPVVLRIFSIWSWTNGQICEVEKLGVIQFGMNHKDIAPGIWSGLTHRCRTMPTNGHLTVSILAVLPRPMHVGVTWVPPRNLESTCM